VRLVNWSAQGQKLYKAASLGCIVAGGVLLFLIFAHLFRCEEVHDAVKLIRRRFR
jgi:hypothetical protein